MNVNLLESEVTLSGMLKSTNTMTADGNASYHIVRCNWIRERKPEIQREQAQKRYWDDCYLHFCLITTTAETRSWGRWKKHICHDVMLTNIRVVRLAVDPASTPASRPHCLSQWRLFVYWPFAIGSQCINNLKFSVRFLRF